MDTDTDLGEQEECKTHRGGAGSVSAGRRDWLNQTNTEKRNLGTGTEAIPPGNHGHQILGERWEVCFRFLLNTLQALAQNYANH